MQDKDLFNYCYISHFVKTWSMFSICVICGGDFKMNCFPHVSVHAVLKEKEAPLSFW